MISRDGSNAGFGVPVIGDRWGVTDAEVARPFPCDDIVAFPELQVWRGVTVAAPPARVWPWVAQVRIAPYSWDWIDNLGRRSPQHLMDLPEPAAGEPFVTAFATRQMGRVLSVEPGRQLTGVIAGAVMSYVLDPEGSSTRLLLKVVMRRAGPAGPLISVGDLLMARRQLMNFKRLSEASS